MYLPNNLRGQISKENSRPECMVVAVRGATPRLWPLGHPQLHSSTWGPISTPWTSQPTRKPIIHPSGNCFLCATLLAYIMWPTLGRTDLGKMATEAQEWAQSNLVRELRVEKGGLKGRGGHRCCDLGPTKSWPSWEKAKLKQRRAP